MGWKDGQQFAATAASMKRQEFASRWRAKPVSR
jgi:hypothetical protein